AQEVHRVEEVVDLEAELHLDVLAHLDVLVDGQVGLEETGAVARVAPRVPVGAELIPVEGPRGRIEPERLVRAVGMAVHTVDHVGASGVVEARARATARDAGNRYRVDGDGIAGRGAHDACDLPVTEE